MNYRKGRGWSVGVGQAATNESCVCVCACVCVCYYIAAAIAVAATATIVATAASHAPPMSSVFLSILSTHAKLEGEKTDRLQSKARVLRQNVLLCSARPKQNIFILSHKNLGKNVVLTLLPLTVWTCFEPTFLSAFSSFFFLLFFSRLVLSSAQS